MTEYDESTTNVQVQVGETFDLTLEAQPTAGYTWQAAVDSSYLVLEEQQFEPDTSAIGAAGQERLVFRALQAGRCQVALAYGRPWERTPRARRTLTVEIVAKYEEEEAL